MWQLLATLFPGRLFPTPIAVAFDLVHQLTDGKLIADLGKTLTRVAIAFIVAMALGTAIGMALGRFKSADRLFSTWVVIGLNVPAIVIAIVLYISLGLTEFALVLAVVLNKLPLVITTVREGVRSLSPDFRDLATVFRLPFARRLRLIIVPQLLPYLLAAARTGLSLIWKIVLVFEVLGSDGGVGFRISVFFQFFNVTAILSYTTAFILIVFAFEYLLLRPIEGRVLRWRAVQT
ncbi:ABC transporter permease [Devosia sp.]|uniref:ABC transporter permease n=1 Tax=Devosia sp. TaxID=1871048 RepID=UPI003BAA9362